MKQESPKSINSIKFTIATDVHLGYKQYDPIRKHDSFHAFEQVLQIASDEHSDFLLLGGDLFDQVNPSQKTIYKCLDLLQQYVQGEGQNNLQARMIDNPDYRINFENQNINIKLPIFTIHGNHDYPSNDFGKLSICDLLHVSNYANYFGKHTDLNQIIIKPLIIQKQGVFMKVAIYGLGYIKDNVLNELFEKGKVHFQQVDNKDQYFCLFIFHQNRYKKGLRAGAPSLKCISSKHIPAWMDLTIWGHEHEAINKIEVENNRKIFQPGSTVITSFIEAESYPKQCLMVEIFDKGEIDLTPIPLKKSYRPMICRNMQIAQVQKKHKQQSREEFDFITYIDYQLNQIIEDIEKEYPGRKPIIRIKVQHTGYEISRWRLLEMKYSQKVANPQSIMTYWKRRADKHIDDKKILEAIISKSNLENQDQKHINEEILRIYAKKQENKQLYFDPNVMHKYHMYSVSRELIKHKDQMKHFINNEIEKKKKPIEKQIQMIFKTLHRDVDTPAKKTLKQLQSLFTLDTKLEDRLGIEGENLLLEQNLNQIWEQQKQLLMLKELDISKSNLTQNYGQTIFFEDLPKNEGPPIISSEQKRETISGKKEKPQFTGTSTAPSSSDNLSSWMACSKPIKVQKMQMDEQKPPIRKGILKNKKIIEISSSSHEEDEEDCCKRAQKSVYDQMGTKRNFEGAKSMVRDNVAKGVKKDVKREAKKEIPKKAEMRGKSVMWSDSEEF